MTYSEFRELVQRMMDAQAAYFKARKEGVAYAELDASKKLERQVRDELKKPRDGQGSFEWDTTVPRLE